MKKIYSILILVLFLVGATNAQIVLSTATPYTQDFNTLANTGTSSTLPLGWQFIEAGTNANLLYNTSNGASNTGDSYSFGATASTERALGGLQSGSLIPLQGVAFKNNTLGTITSITITYIGEQWRLGTLARQDKLDFQYSTDATTVNDGSWTDVNQLDFNAPVQGPTVGALDGNVAANRSTITFTINGIAIPNNTNFLFRWVDFNATGADDGLAIDDFTMTYNISGGPNDNVPPAVLNLFPLHNSVNVPNNPNCFIRFDEGIKRGIGNLLVKKLSDNSIIATVPVAATDVVNNTAGFKLFNLNIGTDYYVEVPAGAYTDSNNNNCIPFGGAGGWKFTTFSPWPTTYNFPFTNCTTSLSEGFTQFSVTGSQTWDCTAFGYNPSNGVQMNGFVTGPGAVTNEDWLISPQLDLSAFAIPLLRFYSINRFNGPQLQLKVSTNYKGYGNPTAATWTDVFGKFPDENTNTWTLCDSINLQNYKQPAVYLAWVYQSSPSLGAARWTLDEIQLFNSTQQPGATVAVSPATYDFGFVPYGSTSAWAPFTFNAVDLKSDLTINAPTHFEVSKDATTAANSISYTPSQAQPGTKTFYVRFKPNAVDASSLTGRLNVSTTGLNQNKSFLSGTSISKTKTLEIVSWNLDWFGKDETPTDPGPWGPTDEDLQEANVKTVLRNIDADVYALVEVCDTARTRKLVDSLNNGTNTWGFAICNYGSGADDPAGPNYPAFFPTAQKEAIVYKKSVLSNVTTRAFLRTAANYDSVRYYWSSGRVPYLVQADATIGGITKPITFLILHAKANTGTDPEKIESYRRRQLGVKAMKDSLDANYANANIIILGDFNDDLDRTIAPGSNTISSYSNLISDSTDANSYKSVTLPLSLQGLRSTVSNADVIDHAVISNEMNEIYMNGTAAIRTDVVGMVASSATIYSNTTTDHYPIFTRYNFLQTGSRLNLLAFNAQRINSTVKLTWQTNNEFSIDYFVVERSNDRINYNTITTVNSIGFTTVPTDYTAFDNNPYSGFNYYRLKIVGRDGKISYSDIKIIYFNNDYKVTVSPNPVKDVINLFVSRNSNDNFSLQIIDAMGRTVKQLTSNTSFTAIPVLHLNKGMYFVRIIDGDRITTNKVILL
jgi:Secretion system C-terminal sorting domain/Bacterial Ig-like domain